MSSLRWRSISVGHVLTFGLKALHGLARQEREIAGEFVDNHTDGPQFLPSSLMANSLQHDTAVIWVDGKEPRVLPNTHMLPREEWPRYLYSRK